MQRRGRRVIFKVIKKPMRYWYPGANVVKEIWRTYKGNLRPGDIIALSDKALSIAYGSVYDEKLIHPDPITKFMTYIASRIFWAKVMHYMFLEDTLSILTSTPLNVLASHKKLSIKIGGLKHFLKPLSEAGIDTTNLPYAYVSLPMQNIDKIVNELKEQLELLSSMPINILVIDSDKCFQPKRYRNIAFATRPTRIKGIVDLGVIAYFIGREFKKYFIEYPTPVAYTGPWLGLRTLLKISKIVDEKRGHGLGRNIIEVLRRLGRRSYDEVTWRDLGRVKHYPAIVVRIMVKK